MPLLGLHRKWLIEKLLVEVLLDIVNEDDGHALVIILGSPSTSHHLENIRDWIVNVAMGLPIIVLCSLDNHKMGREVHPPSKCAGSYEDLE